MGVACLEEDGRGRGMMRRGGGGEGVRWEGDPSRSYAVSAPADQDASQLYYSFCIIWGGGVLIIIYR